MTVVRKPLGWGWTGSRMGRTQGRWTQVEEDVPALALSMR